MPIGSVISVKKIKMSISQRYTDWLNLLTLTQAKQITKNYINRE